MFDVPDDPPPWPNLTPAEINAAGRALVRVPLPPNMTQFEVAKLAREVAMDINEVSTILGHYQLSREQYNTIESLPFYQQVLAAERQAWLSAKNAPERIKLEAAALFEEAMPKLHARMINPLENLNQVAEVAKLIARVAGVGEKDGTASAGGEKFSITINLGDNNPVTYEKTINPLIEAASSMGGGGGAISADTEGAGNRLALPALD